MQAPGGPAAQFNGEPAHHRGGDRRSTSRATASSATPTSSASLREYGGWTGRLELRDRRSSRRRACPTSCPQFLGGGDNGLLHGDLGVSIKTNRPVIEMIIERMPATLVLMGTAFVIWVTHRHRPGRLRGREALLALRPGRDLLQLPLLLAADLLARSHPHLLLRGRNCAGCPRRASSTRATRLLPSTRPSTGTGFWADPVPNLMDIGRHLILPVDHAGGRERRRRQPLSCARPCSTR